MRVAVMNFSGNVGKSTIARHLLAPRMGEAQVIPVESINSDGTEEEALRGKQFGELLKLLLLVEDAVVDIGASNVEDFISRMTQYKGSHQEFDFFVIPVVPKEKQLKDTIATISALAAISIPAEKIRVVFNMVEPDQLPERAFSALFDYYASTKKFTLRPRAVVSLNELYGLLRQTGESIAELLGDETDFRKEIREAKSGAEKVKWAERLALKRLASGATEELDSVFETLFR